MFSLNRTVMKHKYNNLNWRRNCWKLEKSAKNMCHKTYWFDKNIHRVQLKNWTIAFKHLKVSIYIKLLMVHVSISRNAYLIAARYSSRFTRCIAIQTLTPSVLSHNVAYFHVWIHSITKESNRKSIPFKVGKHICLNIFSYQDSFWNKVWKILQHQKKVAKLIVILLIFVYCFKEKINFIGCDCDHLISNILRIS